MLAFLVLASHLYSHGHNTRPSLPSNRLVSSILPGSSYDLGLQAEEGVGCRSALVVQIGPEHTDGSMQDAVVADLDGNEKLTCWGKAWSLHTKKGGSGQPKRSRGLSLYAVISDANGQVLYNTAKRPVRVPRRFWAEDADGKEIFTFKGTWKCTLIAVSLQSIAQSQIFESGNPRFTATLTNHFTSQETNVTVQRSGVMGAADIFLGDDDKGPVMARIFRDFWKKADLVGAHTVSFHTSVE